MEVFGIGLTANMTGLTEFTLRAWERRYRVTTPKRNKSGRRIYTTNDVKRLKLLRLLTERGHSIQDIARLETSKLTSLLKQSEKSQVVQTLLQAVSELDLGLFAACLKNAQLERDTRSFLLEVVAPLLRQIGQKVLEGELEVFHEHATSAIVRNMLSGLLYSVEQLPKAKSTAPMILATPEGDYHEFGILISAILLALRGVKVFYLGPHMPADSLINAVRASQARVLVISCTAPHEVFPTLKWREFITHVATELDPQVSLWMAGPRLTEVDCLGELRKRTHLLLNRFEDLERAADKI